MRMTKRARGAGGGHFPRPVRRTRPSLPALEWAEDAAGRCARVTAIGSHSLRVENHTGILAFTDEYVLLDTGGGSLKILGDHLTLRDARSRVLIVHGSIRRVELPCEGRDSPDEG